MEELYINDANQTVRKRHSKAFWLEIFLTVLGTGMIVLVFASQYAIGEIGLSVSMTSSSVIDPKDPVTIEFNHPMVPAAVENSITISPDAEVDLSWENNYQKLALKPKSHFTSGENYSVEIKPQATFSIKRLLGKPTEAQSLKFSVVKAPEVVSISPVSGDPNVKIDSDIVITFDKATSGYDINFVVEPYNGFDIRSDEERKVFTIHPKDKLENEKDYVISIKEGVSGSQDRGEKLPQVFRANFKTEGKPIVVPDPAPNAVAPSEPIEAKITEGKYIDINLAKQNLSMFEDGEILGTYKVSSGKKGMATPTGTFHVMSKAPRAYSKKYNLYMPYWMQFTGAGHGIHELPEWKSGYKEGANHLGIPVSHGCVRLGVGPAARVYGWAEKGTPIVIHY
jgi:lipoprotein-anchoring transpeptidase ErfK/SrfK